MFKTQALCKSCMRIIFGIRQLGTKTTLAVEGVTTESIILELISKKKFKFLNNFNPTPTFFILLLNWFSVDNETLWLFLNIIKKHCDSKFLVYTRLGSCDVIILNNSWMGPKYANFSYLCCVLIFVINKYILKLLHVRLKQ